VRGLRPPALDELGLIGALRLHAGEVSLPSGLSIEVVASDLGPLGAALEVTAYLIAAEALLNAARHLAGGLYLSAADDGLGIPAHCPTGVGTQSRERAAALGGWVSIAAVEPHGTQVRAWLPAVSS
jgi:two-component system NarL family sensor kinase